MKGYEVKVLLRRLIRVEKVQEDKNLNNEQNKNTKTLRRHKKDFNFLR